MTESHVVSIEEVRSLVAERQQYDDWLAALEARRAETPARVFDRVYADYVGRRSGVMERLNAHVGPLAALTHDLDQRLQELEGRLATLEDERAEAMLRTAVGEFDSARWDAVRADVEAQIGALGGERETLLAEVDEVRTLLASARTEPEATEAVETEQVAAEADVVEQATMSEADGELMDYAAGELDATELAASAADVAVEGAADDTVTAFDTDVLPASYRDAVEMHVVDAMPAENSAAELREVDEALALFDVSHGGTPDAGFVRSLEGIEVELDTATPTTESSDVAAGTGVSESSTVTVTPPSVPADPFDDLAFLRSITEPAGSAELASASAPASAAPADAQKTLRCTECNTMNLPTEWYCERCGGELAAF